MSSESQLPAGPASVLYYPGRALQERSTASAFRMWLARSKGLVFPDHRALWRWSVACLEDFWASIWEYFAVVSHAPPHAVLSERTMPGARWFPGARLNYAEHCTGRPEDADKVALIARSDTRPDLEMTFGHLNDEVARCRAGLQRLGVGPGDHVAGFLPNIHEAVVAFLASASLGAVWAVVSPELGPRGVVERLAQLEPAVLLAVTGYRYGAADVDRSDELAAVRRGLPSLRHVVHVPYGAGSIEGALSWMQLLGDGPTPALAFDPVPFDHPLCVSFSSGTTGKPKAILHSHGGILLEHLKNHGLHWDLRPGDRLQWFTTTSWTMWHTLVSALLLRASMVLLDGNPRHPELREQWRVAAELRTTAFGASADYLRDCRDEGVHPAAEFDLSAIRQVIVSASPLPAEGFRWLHDEFGDDVLVNSCCGGSDVCSGLVQAIPIGPVYDGEISGACLATDAYAVDAAGRRVVGEVGELVVGQPLPSMPLGFAGDPDGSAYRAAYFERFPGRWHDGDSVRFSDTGSCVVTGRVDAALSRDGVLLGTTELYEVVEELPDVAAALVVQLPDRSGSPGEVVLLVQPADGFHLDEALRDRLRAVIRYELAARYVPDVIEPIRSVPVNWAGKKLEVPVMRILAGADPATVASPDDLVDPRSLDDVVALAASRRVG